MVALEKKENRKKKDSSGNTASIIMTNIKEMIEKENFSYIMRDLLSSE